MLRKSGILLEPLESPAVEHWGTTTPGACINAALDNASGEWIFVINADGVVCPGYQGEAQRGPKFVKWLLLQWLLVLTTLEARMKYHRREKANVRKRYAHNLPT